MINKKSGLTRVVISSELSKHKLIRPVLSSIWMVKSIVGMRYGNKLTLYINWHLIWCIFKKVTNCHGLYGMALLVGQRVNLPTCYYMSTNQHSKYPHDNLSKPACQVLPIHVEYECIRSCQIQCEPNILGWHIVTNNIFLVLPCQLCIWTPKEILP